MLLRSEANPVQIRELRVCPHHWNTVPRVPPRPPAPPPPQSEHMARLVKVPGIVISSSGVRAKATRITIQCRSCRTFRSNIAIRPGLEGYSLPRKCNTYALLALVGSFGCLQVFPLQGASWPAKVSH